MVDAISGLRPMTATEQRRWIAHAEVILDRLPVLIYERSRLLAVGVEPTGVLLPARLNVPYEGDDATEFKGSCMGLPITWSDDERWGLIFTLPEPRTGVTPSVGD